MIPRAVAPVLSVMPLAEEARADLVSAATHTRAYGLPEGTIVGILRGRGGTYGIHFPAVLAMARGLSQREKTRFRKMRTGRRPPIRRMPGRPGPFDHIVKDLLRETPPTFTPAPIKLPLLGEKAWQPPRRIYDLPRLPTGRPVRPIFRRPPRRFYPRRPRA